MRSTRSYSRSATLGIVIRRLELAVSPLEQMFFALTSAEPHQKVELRDLAERVLAR